MTNQVIDDTFYDSKVAGWWVKHDSSTPPECCFVEFWNPDSLANAVAKSGVVVCIPGRTHLCVFVVRILYQLPAVVESVARVAHFVRQQNLAGLLGRWTRCDS